MTIHLRRAVRDDLTKITQLFYDTISTVNAADYTKGQIAAWRAGSWHTERWLNRIDNQCFFVAVASEQVVGIGSLTVWGHLDVLYVHKDYQRQGIAQQLTDAIERIAHALYLPVITSDVSLTARPFFEKQGFRVVTEQEIVVAGVTLSNVKMAKLLTSAL